MANKILIKKSSTQGAVPTTAQLDLAELAINTFDGRLFAKKNDGSASIVDLKQNDPIRILGDASSTYSASSTSGEYYSNVTMTLNNVNSNSGVYGGKSGSGLSQVIRIPQITVNTKGLVTDSANVSFTLSDLGFGTMAQQNANAVAITGGTIDGTAIGGTTAAAGTFTTLDSTGAATLDSLDVTNNATVGGTLGVTGATTLTGGATVGTLTAGRVTFAGTGGLLSDSGDLTFNSTSGNLTAKGGVITNDLHVGGSTYINGDLTVRGTTTTVNSTTVAIGDLNIELAKDATNAAQADGGGITVHGPTTAATITYASVDDSWNFNKKVNLANLVATGNVDADNFNATHKISSATLATTGAATVGGTLGVTGTTTLSGDLSVGGNETVTGTLGVTGATTLTTLTTSGAATLNSASITNGATVGGTLDVTGATTFTTATGGGLQVKAIGNVTPGTAAFTTLTASGATTLTDTTQSTDKDTGALVVEGGVGIEKNLNVGGALGVTGNASVNGLSVTQNGSVGGTFTVTGGTSLSTVTTSGAATLNSASITNNATVGGTLGVTGVTTLSDDLGVGGDATVTGTLGVTGHTTLTTVTTGNATINGASITQNASVGGTLDVTGDATIAGTLNANNGIAVDTNKFTVANGTGNTYIDGTLQVHGAATFDDAATFTGLVTGGGLKATDLTATRIVFAGTGGRLVDSANLTWDGSKFYVNGKGEFSGNVTMTGVQTYTAADYTTGALQVAGDASFAGKIQVQGTIYTGGNQVLDTTSTIDGGTY